MSGQLSGGDGGDGGGGGAFVGKVVGGKAEAVEFPARVKYTQSYLSIRRLVTCFVRTVL